MGVQHTQQHKRRCQVVSGSGHSGSGQGPAVLGNGCTEFSFNSIKMLSIPHPTKGNETKRGIILKKHKIINWGLCIQIEVVLLWGCFFSKKRL